MNDVCRKIWIVLVVLLIIFSGLHFSIAQADTSSPTLVAVMPSAKTVNLGESFEIEVWVNDTPPMYGADVILTFDPALLEVQDDNPLQSGVQIENGGFLQPGFMVYNYADNTTGIIRYTNTQINPMPDAIGSGKLFVVHFKAKGLGTSSLNFTKADLANRNGQTIFAQTQNGSVQIILQRPMADLALGIDAPQSVFVGSNYSYYITIDNAGPHAAEDVSVTIELDSLISYQRSGGLNWNCEYQADTHTLVCGRQAIAAGASAAPITVTVTAPEQPSQVAIRAAVSMSDAVEDPNPANNSASAQTTVTQEQADLGLEILAPASVNADSSYEYELRVANAGPGDAREVRLIFEIPQGVIFRSVSGLGWSCLHNNGVVECTLEALARGSMASPIRVQVTAPSAGGKITAIGTVSLSPLVNDPFPENNQRNVETIVVELPPTGPSFILYLPLVLNNAP